MKHLLCTGKSVSDIPDWAIRRRQPIEQAEPEQAVLAQLGMPTKPYFFAERLVGGVREVVSWTDHYATEVRCRP